MQAPATGGVRFAPSPTGKFHVGNLRTAWISFEIAKTLGLRWIVRFEDIDRPRVLPGAQEQQLADLNLLGLKPNQVLLQSDFNGRHLSLFEQAVNEKRVYACNCSRKEVQQALATMASAPHLAPPTYSGQCRHQKIQNPKLTGAFAWRFKMPDESGKDDFIVARTGSEFIPSYHWACAIDDHDGDYDLLVRSSDLRESLSPQRAIQAWLGRRNPIPVFHTSLVTQNDGHRLEKRTQGVTLSELQTRSISSAELIKIFSNSFKASEIKTLNSDPLLGESKDTITLRDLSL